VVNHKTYEAVRYVNEQGDVHYYTPKGDSLESEFLRSPVNYTRLSSPFAPNRMHPVLHYKRPHYGVDLAAPMGTPIKATADGVVSFIGRKGGYGKVVFLQHSRRYATRYAHMSRFNTSLHMGSRVKRGQIIGYVGMTGVADGPHVHYELRIYDQPRNPMSTALPTALPIASKETHAFSEQAAYYLRLLPGSAQTLGA
ncbi:MAG: Peptidase, partial [Gammaproteobacteria bacterium]|nr:Peptidase [Gammaproteobacteria bacterium]